MQSQDYIKFDWDFNWTRRVVSSITISSQNLSAYLNTDANPSTPYIPLYPWSPTTKQYVDQHDTVVSATAPSSPTEWMVWYDSTNDVLKVYNGSSWESITTWWAISDTAYWPGWDGQTTIAPSQNAVYDKISSIDALIPSEATSSNKLADKDFVGDSINSVTAYYITKNANWDQFATYAELAAATTFYSGGVVRVPTKNDYTIVLSDENHDNATTRYIYNNGWEYQYTINETPLTQAQLNALNSGITSGKVTTYDWYATTIASKANDSEVVKLSGNQTINGTKTFGTSPVVPSKTTAATNTWTAIATEAQVYKKQDTLVSGTNIKTVNSNSLLWSWNLTLNDVKVSATAPSSPTEWMVWYDTTNDQLKVYDWTSWQLVLNEWDYIDISNRDSRQWPCPDWFIVPSSTEFASIKDAWITLWAWTSSSFENIKKYLKIPPNSYYKYDWTQDWVPTSKTSYAYIRFRNRYSTNNSLFYRLQLASSIYSIGSWMSKSSAFPIRPLKTTPVAPDSNWTTLFDGSSVATNAGIFWNQTLWLISISADWTTWYTIKDKNIWATKVYDYDNMILAEFNSEAVVWKLFQWWNNYPFPYDSINSIKLSSTQIDGTQFWPSQYYSPIFITSSAYNTTWDNPANWDLRWNVSWIIKNAINNTWVKTINAKTWHVEIEEYTAWKWIQIIKEDYSAMRWPLPEFFHVWTRDDLNKLYAYLTVLWLTTWSDFKAAIKLPSAWNIRANDLVIESRWSYWEIISAVSNWDTSIYRISISNSSIYNQTSPGNKSAWYNIRGFYDLKVAPDSTWTMFVDGSSIATWAWVFHNPTLWLISISWDWINWITIADKNCWATTVWNDGDTLSEANCWKYYQRWNNYGFPFDATWITTSSTKVDASAYWPWNYYSSSTFILSDIAWYTRAWDDPVNKNLWWWETGKKILDKSSINNTGVLSVNGQTGDVTIPTSEDSNTKTFYLSTTSDLTTAQAAYDWYAAGKNPIIVYGNSTYTLYDVLSGQMVFRSTIIDVYDDDNNWYSSRNIRKLSFIIVLDTVTNIVSDFSNLYWDFLRTWKNYTTPYTPQYDWSPATKKYVDDSVSVVSGDSGVTYTIKVSNSDPASWTASNIITLVP